MKSSVALAACLALIGVCLTPPASAVARRGPLLDLSMRRAAYFNFKSHAEIDLKGTYVAAGGTVKVNKAASTSCQSEGCKFAVGLILFRNVTDGDPAFKVSLVGGQTETLVFGFPKGEKTFMARHETPHLKAGPNKIKVVLDPDDKVAEANEGNNSFEFTIVVEGE